MNDVEATQTRIRGNQNYLKDSVKKKFFTKQLIFSLEQHLLVKWFSIFFLVSRFNYASIIENGIDRIINYDSSTTRNMNLNTKSEIKNKI